MTGISNTFWSGKRVFVTGHTGFKGAWLILWLRELGARTGAVSLAPSTEPNLHGLLFGQAPADEICDIRDARTLVQRMQAFEPEIVIHMAAQPLVRASYLRPQETFETNVMGTANVLQAIRETASVRVGVIVTTDKVYENNGEGRPFIETDRLGGHDPYSNSKACAELVTQSYRDSYFSTAGATAIATARAGNVIGGGDWSEDRLVPDLVRAMIAGQPVELRYPASVRPWQHVLDPLSGYLRLAERLFIDPATAPKAVNFGPDPDGFVTVSALVEQLDGALDGRGWRQAPGDHPKEATVLTLATALAKESLLWQPGLDVTQTIGWTADWYRAWHAGADMRAFTLSQINTYRQRTART
jgi:CDP-glucose 4,6-dehydratase